MPATPKVIRTGAAKSNPFTICIIANPALEAPWQSGIFIADPIIAKPEAVFNAAAAYIEAALFGGLPQQAERLLGDPAIALSVRLVSIFDQGVAPQAASSLVGQHLASSLLVARRSVFKAFLASYGLSADIAYAVSASTSHTRASAWFTSDDDAGAGVPFTLDGVQLFHRFNNIIPGTIAIHSTANSVTAAHEFQHAISSYTNGSIVDLYVDSPPALNCGVGRPIPVVFGSYNASSFNSDQSRDHIGYPPQWTSYHCALTNPNFPALMDDYWKSSTVPEVCENDEITHQFVIDQVMAKINRP